MVATRDLSVARRDVDLRSRPVSSVKRSRFIPMSPRRRNVSRRTARLVRRMRCAVAVLGCCPVDKLGEVRQHQRDGSAEAGRRSVSWWLLVYAAVVVVSFAFEANAKSAPQETVVWLQGCPWLLVGLSIHAAVSLGSRKDQ